jgi:hypothetical protein
MNGIAQGELLTHRVSGYYTSSQSSVNDMDIGMYCRNIGAPATVEFEKCKPNILTLFFTLIEPENKYEVY